jgi:hypothetical protein
MSMRCFWYLLAADPRAHVRAGLLWGPSVGRSSAAPASVARDRRRSYCELELLRPGPIIPVALGVAHDTDGPNISRRRLESSRICAKFVTHLPKAVRAGERRSERERAV